MRIRKANNEAMELIFKGKTNDLFGNYTKMENNLDANINSCNILKDILFSLDCYGYCTVNKTGVFKTRKQKSFNRPPT